MSEAPAASARRAETFDDLDRSLREAGPAAALELLIGRLDDRGDFRALLDALLLKARHDLGLPLVQLGNLGDLPDDLRTRYEDRYIEAIRTVGGKLLAAGEIPAAWPYFRAIGETEPVVKAIEAYEPGDGDETVGQVVEVAFTQGAAPRKGYELILKHFGTCSAVSAFEHLPRDEATRKACAGMLVRQVHEHLVGNLRAEITQRGQPLPAQGASVESLVAGRDWLFADDAYHIDISHLASTVRVSPLLDDPMELKLAADLTDYGRRLSDRHRYEGEPPFDDLYGDHGVYLKALLGRDADAAVEHFRSKLDGSPDELVDGDAEPSRRDDAVAAQVLVGLLVRLGRVDEAIAVSAEYLAGLPESALFCPGVAQLCQRAGRANELARIAREQGDLVHYTAAILQGGTA
jgi:hypothetical protein